MTGAARQGPAGGAPGVGAALGRGAFLACSWTWVIGMFLPTLLVTDFGWPGWAAFAAPNVVGAAAVGFVWKRRGAVAEAVARHGGAMRAFSVVTIVFHVAFVSWMLAFLMPGAFEPVAAGAAAGLVGLVTVLTPTFALLGMRTPVALPAVSALAAAASLVVWQWTLRPEAAAIAVALGLVGVAALMSGMSSRGWVRAAVVFLLLSAACAALAWWTTSRGGAYAWPPASGAEPPLALLWVAPALAFGFLLCPHLDLTLLRTREETPGPAGDAAFVVGFGALFLAMITLSLAYSTTFLVGTVTSHYLVLHVCGQSVFTVGAHLRELRERGVLRAVPAGARDNGGLALLAPLLLLGAAGAWVAFRGMERTYYESFLAAYALPFPAYVWIVMVPRRRRPSHGVALAAFAAATLVAAPLMWMGHAGERWWLIGPALAVPLLTPLAWRLTGGARTAPVSAAQGRFGG